MVSQDRYGIRSDWASLAGAGNLVA
jgi:hypothetical protein